MNIGLKINKDLYFDFWLHKYHIFKSYLNMFRNNSQINYTCIEMQILLAGIHQVELFFLLMLITGYGKGILLMMLINKTIKGSIPYGHAVYSTVTLSGLILAVRE